MGTMHAETSVGTGETEFELLVVELFDAAL
jgi:hypothetical protein